MHSLPRRCFLVLALGLILASRAPGATNYIAGTISSDVTWSGTNQLSGTVTIQTGAIVTVASGATILMSNAATLVINGQLLANGASNAPILFTRAVTGQTWSRLRFVRASDSVLRYCTFEFANSAGEHQDYYPTNCTTGLGQNPRNYHEAIVALATHLDVEGCLFRNLPDTSATAEGDAFAIISDDPQFPGPASARISNCRFLSIGQAIHTRFSYVLVEGCTFSGKRGDNDDIDMYGESEPVPLIRNNTFLAGHEDKINPTRCSAIIMNNFLSGSDDHGIVLRDKCRPIVFNNIISNCTAAAISVQNQCDALIANNTIINSGRGIRLFDHTSRHGPPYCLFPGNGKVTVINTVIWNWTIGALTTEESAFQPFPYMTVLNCDIQSGANLIVTNGTTTTVVWGPGNLALDPLFASGQRLTASSPCVDAGTNVTLAATNFDLTVADSLYGIPRPLDGNGDGVARFDIGADEFLLPAADSNADGIPDGWTWQYRLNPAAPDIASANPDNDPHTTLEEWYADTNPTNALSYLQLAPFSNSPPGTLQFQSSAARLYTLYTSTNLHDSFGPVAGQIDIPGNGGLRSLNDPAPGPEKFYRVRARVP